MGDNRAQVVAGGLLQQPRRVDGLVPVLFLFVDVDELTQRLHAVIPAVGKLAKKILGAIEKPGAQVVMSELEQRLAALPALQVRPRNQVLVNADGAIDLAAATIEISEREMGLDGLAVDLENLDEGLDGLIGLLVEKVVDALEIVRTQIVFRSRRFPSAFSVAPDQPA